MSTTSSTIAFRILHATLAVVSTTAVSIGTARTSGAADAGSLSLRSRTGETVTQTVDGNVVRAAISLAQPATRDTRVMFRLSGDDAPAAECLVRSGQSSCESPDIDTLGWRWAGSSHAVIAEIDDGAPIEAPITVAPRPVVLVHGFNSSHETWAPYLGANGFLAQRGMQGFAVGDGRASGVLDTGTMTDPRRRTNSLTQNAAILAEYIDGVRRLTGAERVDVVAHSMGGLITRQYLDRFAAEGSVAQLLTLGTPMAGTDCAVLPASLGLLLPATIEIQPHYVTDIVNTRITQRRGARFYLLAGTPRLSAIQSPCADAPSDLVVSSNSVRGIPASVSELPALHTDMTGSREVFDQFVATKLMRPRREWAAPQQLEDARADSARQFTRVHTGHLDPGSSAEVVIDIEPGVAVASFALYDTSRTLDVAVTGASGKTITLDVQKNGLVRVEDPSSLLYLGYGFENPKPGKWRVTLSTTPRTPSTGADFAITAQFHGGAQLLAETDATVVRQGEYIVARARLTRDGKPLEMRSARAVLRDAESVTTTLDMPIENGIAAIRFVPTKSGAHMVSIEVAGVDASGADVDRSAFLAFEVEPPSSAPWRGIFAIAAVVAVLAGAAVIVIALARRRRR
jgi:pimeloyl-ACP methyl ester carboxylesterase